MEFSVPLSFNMHGHVAPTLPSVYATPVMLKGGVPFSGSPAKMTAESLNFLYSTAKILGAIVSKLVSGIAPQSRGRSVPPSTWTYPSLIDLGNNLV